MKTLQPWNPAVPGLQIYWPEDEGGILEFYNLNPQNALVPSLAIWGKRKLAYAARVRIERRTNQIDFIFSENPVAFKNRDWSLFPGTVRVVVEPTHSSPIPVQVLWIPDGNTDCEELEELTDWTFNLPNAVDLRLNPTRTKSLVLRTDRPEQALLKLIALSESPRCAISGCEVVECIDLAHIVPVKNGGPELIENTLLLRADLHRLFDAGLLKIRSDSLRRVVELDPSLRNDRYIGLFHGKEVASIRNNAMEPYFKERERLAQCTDEA